MDKESMIRFIFNWGKGNSDKKGNYLFEVDFKKWKMKISNTKTKYWIKFDQINPNMTLVCSIINNGVEIVDQGVEL